MIKGVKTGEIGYTKVTEDEILKDVKEYIKFQDKYRNAEEY